MKSEGDLPLPKVLGGLSNLSAVLENIHESTLLEIVVCRMLADV